MLYCIYSICAAPLKCATLRYYLKGLSLFLEIILTVLHRTFCLQLLLVFSYLKYSYPSKK